MLPVRLIVALSVLLFAVAAGAQGMADRTLIVGSEQDYPPFATGLTDATAGGFTVDLWQVVAREAGLDYRIRVLPFHQLLQEFKAGRIDVLINLAQSEERHKFADFTVPHVTVHGAIFIRKGQPDIHSEQDLIGKSIIVVEADIGHEYALGKGWENQLTLVPTAADGLRRLASGRHDAMFVSKLVGMQTLEKLKLPGIVALPVSAGAKQKFAFAVRKGDAELLALLNEGLALSKSSGAYDALYQKWFSVYEVKEPGLRDALYYLLPLLALSLGLVLFAYYRRHIERQRAVQQLAESHHMLQTVIDTIPMRLFWKDTESRILGCNSLFARDAGASAAAEVVGKLDEQLAWRDQAACYRADDLSVMASGQAKLAYEEPQTAPDGREVYLRTSKVPLRSVDQAVVGVLGVYEDITEARRLQEEMQLASMVYKSSSEAMLVTDADGNIININPAFTEMTGYTLDEVEGRNTRMFNSGHHDRAFFEAMWQALNTVGSWQGEVWDRRKNGEIYPKWLTINTYFNKEGAPHRRVALFSDITAQKKAEKLIWQQANFDALTGLPNRRMFHDRLDQEVKKALRGERRLALLFIDLDRFKEVNDTLGHDKGDLLLAEVAQRLKACVRDSDTVARLGGDEFTVILGALDDSRGIDRIAQAILKDMTAPFSLDGEMAYVSASMGITLYPDDATVIETLIKNADQAMYEAKSQGRNRFSYFTPAMDEAAKARMHLNQDLRMALSEQQFWIAYQPIVELATGQIHKAEALIRWQHPVRGLISPGEFIPVAEETGAIIDIGNWVFLEAVRQVTRWRASHDPEFQVSVNKSPVQFLNDGAITKGWLELMQDMDIPPHSIVIEITEGLLLHGAPIVADKLIRFRNRTMKIAIDDFGTGYSSLAYLKKFDIDYLKIDQAFVRNLVLRDEDLAICEAIIVMAHKLGIKVIAEGVETREQRDLLLASGCDYGQGYFFSRPIAAPEFEQLPGMVRRPGH
ncbi:MAG: EAL domain-containing protein [Gallionellaceae bacterium]|nr:EAL domain-containing protein [Gallionellaceae bacterium]